MFLPPSAGHAGPDVGGAALLHPQAVLVEVPVHVGGLLRHHQLRGLQGHAQTAVLQDAQVVQSQVATLVRLLLLVTVATSLLLQAGLQVVPVDLQAELRGGGAGLPRHHVHHVWPQRLLQVSLNTPAGSLEPGPNLLPVLQDQDGGLHGRGRAPALLRALLRRPGSRLC